MMLHTWVMSLSKLWLSLPSECSELARIWRRLKSKRCEMPYERSKTWRLNRQISVSVLVELTFLAALILTSWVNLQRQLDLLQRDVTLLLDSQKDLQSRLESLSAKSISYEYRLRALEKQADAGNGSDESL